MVLGIRECGVSNIEYETWRLGNGIVAVALTSKKDMPGFSRQSFQFKAIIHPEPLASQVPPMVQLLRPIEEQRMTLPLSPIQPPVATMDMEYALQQ